jgi:hypothetical protein
MDKNDKSLLPNPKPHKNTLYDVPNKTESAQKITNLLNQSNQLFVESITRPKTDIYNPEELVRSTNEYFEYCREHGTMPSFRRLANWYGYSYKQLYRNIDKENETGLFLDRVRDAIKDNLEQAALVNAVNNISAMFILKTQHDYVEATKVVLEPSDKLLGQPKTVEEIADYIDADIVEE